MSTTAVGVILSLVVPDWPSHIQPRGTERGSLPPSVPPFMYTSRAYPALIICSLPFLLLLLLLLRKPERRFLRPRSSLAFEDKSRFTAPEGLNWTQRKYQSLILEMFQKNYLC